MTPTQPHPAPPHPTRCIPGVHCWLLLLCPGQLNASYRVTRNGDPVPLLMMCQRQDSGVQACRPTERNAYHVAQARKFGLVGVHCVVVWLLWR